MGRSEELRARNATQRAASIPIFYQGATKYILTYPELLNSLSFCVAEPSNFFLILLEREVW
jgi:hypothetical protein